MGVEPPFIYDKPSNYTFAGPTTRAFDPKAATRASWQPPAPKIKKDGPLVEFNKHPDSYLIVPYGNLNVEPMNPKTKARVKRARTLQLSLRVLALLGALGLLFCIISINKTSSSVGWVIRVGPAVALCHTVYAVYHLCRDPAGRSAASSASYMLFAAMLDTGLIPFFAFSAIMANSDYTTNAYGWSTLFGDSTMSYKIIYAFALTCIAEASLLLISLGLDIYLAIVFRKIAKMPPDMNPLEDNLTARPNGGRHKRNKSEMVFEKHLSGSTLADQRFSHLSEDSRPSTRRVPFIHTRTDSADRMTLYGNEKALNSRISLRNEMIENKNDPYRMSQASSHDTLVPSRPVSAVTPAANVRAGPGAGLDHKPARSSGLTQVKKNTRSWLSYVDYEGVPRPMSDVASDDLDHTIRPFSPVSMMSDHEANHNLHQEPEPVRMSVERQNWYQGSARQSQVLLPEHQDDHHIQQQLHEQLHESLTVPSPQSKKRSRDPLGMNPPTPVRGYFQNENSMPTEYETVLQPEPLRYSTPPRQPLDDVHVNSSSRPGMGSRPSSFVGSGGKSRYYGNLRNSLGGSPTRASFHEGDDMEYYDRNGTHQVEETDNFRVYDSGDEEAEEEDEYDGRREAELNRQAHAIMLGIPQKSDQFNGVRKVSNTTGLDLRGGYAGLGEEFGRGMARRREVSGKVAEEGRGLGYGGIGAPEEREGGIYTGQASRGGAAGWARFKGL